MWWTSSSSGRSRQGDEEKLPGDAAPQEENAGRGGAGGSGRSGGAEGSGGSGSNSAAEKKLEKELMPTFKQLATHFAALHDTPGVMLHKRAIREIVPWDQARGFFASRLRMRVAEERVKSMVRVAAPATTEEEMASHLSRVSSALEDISAAEDEPVVPEEHDEVKSLLAGL